MIFGQVLVLVALYLWLPEIFPRWLYGGHTWHWYPAFSPAPCLLGGRTPSSAGWPTSGRSPRVWWGFLDPSSVPCFVKPAKKTKSINTHDGNDRTRELLKNHTQNIFLSTDHRTVAVSFWYPLYPSNQTRVALFTTARSECKHTVNILTYLRCSWYIIL